MTLPKKVHHTRGNTLKDKLNENGNGNYQKNATEQYIINEVEQAKANIMDSMNAAIKKTLEESTTQNNANINRLKYKINELEKYIKYLEDDVDYLLGRNYSVEANIFNLQQRSRRNNLEIHGIPNDILDENLENTILEILNINSLTSEEITNFDIEACHRLPGKRGYPKPVIIKFLCRKVRDEILFNRENLYDIDLSKYGYDEDKNTLYINDNLSPHSKNIKYHCRNLRRDGIIKIYTFEHCNFKIKFVEGDRWYKINHEDDLYSLFPEYFNE